MKILITGINGQVGHALMRELTEHELIGLTRQDCDLTIQIKSNKSSTSTNRTSSSTPRPTRKSTRRKTSRIGFLINRDAPKVMAEKAREYNIPFIHFSTDYVFDGEKKEAYVEDDPPIR